MLIITEVSHAVCDQVVVGMDLILFWKLPLRLKSIYIYIYICMTNTLSLKLQGTTVLNIGLAASCASIFDNKRGNHMAKSGLVCI